MSATQTKYDLFINNPLILEQNANPYGIYINEGAYDYTFVINLQTAVTSADITTIFTNASFFQNASNADAVDINLALNQATVHSNWGTINNASMVTVLVGNSDVAFGTLKPTSSEKIGDRLLEVVAHKLFGHGQAHAAIMNDHEYYTHDGQIWNHLSNSLANSSFAHHLFNQYVATERYETEATRLGASEANSNGNDVDRWVKFNFSGFTFDYPLYVNGVVNYDASITGNELNVLKNGPDVHGTKLVNGSYNIPILVRFTC
jgi:hypothetical protein